MGSFALNTPGRIEVLAIGDELLDGRVADSNTLRLARALAEVGLEIAQRTTVRDDLDVIAAHARAVAARGTELCVVSGGLGPTSDDLTSEAFAALLGVPLLRDADQARRIEARLLARGRGVTPNQLKQADRPETSEVIANDQGTAPGFAVTYQGCRFVALPGVPREFDAMAEWAVLAPLRATLPPLAKRVLKSFGLIEAEVDARLADLGKLAPTVRVGYRAKFPEIHVSLLAKGEKELQEATALVRERLGPHLFAEDESRFAEVLLSALRARGHSLATAESCTGGLIADMLTDIPGSSEVFTGGVIAYAYATKSDLLGVKNDTLSREGAVSEATVQEMAAGARQRFGSTWAVAVSGIAGPGGGTADKPIGTVWIALAGAALSRTKKLQLPFDRRGNKVVSAYSALDLLRRELLHD